MLKLLSLGLGPLCLLLMCVIAVALTAVQRMASASSVLAKEATLDECNIQTRRMSTMHHTHIVSVEPAARTEH